MDVELAPYDIAGSIAHARGLLAAGLLTESELARLEKALGKVHSEIESGAFDFADSDEDIHTAIERRLTELDPKVAGKLHTGRSRNDQVALDLRLYCRAASAGIGLSLSGVLAALALLARRHADWAMPGYTHLQRAQPVTVGHHLLAHAEPLLRDGGRLRNAFEAAGEMPLGAGALAASTLPLQRAVVARELGFSRLTENSMDAVSDRDFALDLVYVCTMIGLHLSRLGEDVVLWSSSEFGFVDLADEISTGSSLMPQKRNPDIAELLRGRAGRPLGSLVTLATVLKGLPLSYDKDLQEDKAAIFAAVDNCIDCLDAAALMIERLAFNRARLSAAVADPGLLATDTAENLVRAGIPFREAHRDVGRQVLEGTHQPAGDADASLRRRDLTGGPAPTRVRRRAAAMLAKAAALQRWAEASA